MMLKLAHRVLSQPVRIVNEAFDGGDEFAKSSVLSDKMFLEHAPIVLADNVSAYFESLNKSHISVADFPNARSPFAELWIEWQPTHEVLAGFSALGVMCRSADTESIKDMLPSWVVDDHGLIQHFNFYGCVNGSPLSLDCNIFVLSSTSGAVTEFRVVRRGIFVSDAIALSALAPAMLALSFMNCRNVASRDVSDTANPSGKWLRRQKQPRLTYHVLDIVPMKEVLRAEGGVEHNGLKKALHICRGHFATYTPDKPLFGHITGTFWKPSHVRGDIKQGAVVKDYSIIAENN